MMIRRTAVRIAFALAFVASAAPPAPAAPADSARAAPFDSAAALAKARRLNAALRLKEAPKLWAEFNETMRTALGGELEKLVEAIAQISAQTGTMQECVSEVLQRQAGYWVYLGKCRFEKSPVPLVTQYAFDENGRVGGFFVKPETREYDSKFLEYRTKTPLKLPFHGEWEVVWGGRGIRDNYHAVARDQRFAYDLLVVRDSLDHSGTGRLASDYFAFGLPIIAPAAGKVVWVSDGVADNRPGAMNPTQPMGNGVVLDHGNAEFSLFAHLQRGSVRVQLDSLVAEGDTLGLCGNSGNSSQPHLHYHLQNGPTLFEADGLPAPFVDYVSNGKPVERGEPVRGERIRRK